MDTTRRDLLRGVAALSAVPAASQTSPIRGDGPPAYRIVYNWDGAPHDYSEFPQSLEQFIEKTEETKRTVRLRMAILDIEHHLNRLYPDIGNMACDLWKAGETPLLDNDELKAKVELVWEYLERRETLRAELKQVVNERRKGG